MNPMRTGGPPLWACAASPLVISVASAAVNVPAPLFERHLREPQALATALGEAGVDPALVMQFWDGKDALFTRAC